MSRRATGADGKCARGWLRGVSRPRFAVCSQPAVVDSTMNFEFGVIMPIPQLNANSPA